MLETALLFRNGMVIQRDKPVTVWGTAAPGAAVRVAMQNRTAECTADADGRWKAVCGPFCASFSEEMILSSGGEEKRIRDVAVGEVWLAGGQSNMEFAMRFDRGLEKEKQRSGREIRYFEYPRVSYPEQITEADYGRQYGIWRKAQPEQLERFSAVGYYFADCLHQRYGIPVGIIGCNWGGTPACSWMPEEAVEACAPAWLEDYRAALASLDVEAYCRDFRRNAANFHTDWFAEPMYDILQVGYSSEEIAEKAAALGNGESLQPPVIGPLHEWRPCGLYESMLTRVAPYTVRGFLWYQGEADDAKAELYHRVFPELIRCWRALWQEELPFLFVQLAPFRRWLACTGTRWPEIRAAQQWTADNVSGTAMAVITDAGMEWDIHPKEKRPVGERLALLAEHYVYGEDMLCEAPRMRSVTAGEGRIVILFDYAGDGLVLDGPVLSALEVFQNGYPVAVSRCEAEGNTVLVFGEGIRPEVPTEVRLAWTDYYQVNLRNSAGIPARPGIASTGFRR